MTPSAVSKMSKRKADVADISDALSSQHRSKRAKTATITPGSGSPQAASKNVNNIPNATNAAGATAPVVDNSPPIITKPVRPSGRLNAAQMAAWKTTDKAYKDEQMTWIITTRDNYVPEPNGTRSTTEHPLAFIDVAKLYGTRYMGYGATVTFQAISKRYNAGIDAFCAANPGHPRNIVYGGPPPPAPVMIAPVPSPAPLQPVPLQLAPIQPKQHVKVAGPTRAAVNRASVPKPKMKAKKPRRNSMTDRPPFSDIFEDRPEFKKKTPTLYFDDVSDVEEEENEETDEGWRGFKDRISGDHPREMLTKVRGVVARKEPGKPVRYVRTDEWKAEWTGPLQPGWNYPGIYVPPKMEKPYKAPSRVIDYGSESEGEVTAWNDWKPPHLAKAPRTKPTLGSAVLHQRDDRLRR